MRPDQKSSLFLIVDIYLLYSTMFSSHYLLSEVFWPFKHCLLSWMSFLIHDLSVDLKNQDTIKKPEAWDK